MKIIMKTVSDLEKVFLDQEPLSVVNGHSALMNESSAFQVAFTGVRDGGMNPWGVTFPIKLLVESPIKDYIRVRHVEHVPVRVACFPSSDADYLRRGPGLYPDLLVDIPQNRMHIYTDQWDSAWIDIEPNGKVAAGEYPITIKMIPDNLPEDAEIPVLAQATYTVRLINAELPEQTLLHTKWFHYDGIAYQYNCEMFSEKFWEILENNMCAMSRLGINTILTPVHTPPLDTRVGGERMTCQLVDITCENGKWTFGFDKLDRFIALAKKSGLKYFEIAHFFTQWGAKYAPKIMATVNGEYKRVFGWDTDGTGDAYASFLREYVPAIVNELRKTGVLSECLFHVSDEPGKDHLEGYIKAKNILKPLLEGSVIIDALSDFDFYASGAVDKPIPAVDHIEPFLEAKVPGLWSYYCIGQHKDVSNMFIAMPSYRNRIYAEMLYKYEIEGILQWGFNFYNSQYSDYPILPFIDTESHGFSIAGDAYQVYPGANGQPIESIRAMVTLHAMQDLRAMQLLEKLAGRELVLALLAENGGENITFSVYPRNEQYILNLREKINEEIAKRI